MISCLMLRTSLTSAANNNGHMWFAFPYAGVYLLWGYWGS